jgi:hypothetical protein
VGKEEGLEKTANFGLKRAFAIFIKEYTDKTMILLVLDFLKVVGDYSLFYLLTSSPVGCIFAKAVLIEQIVKGLSSRNERKDPSSWEQIVSRVIE